MTGGFTAADNAAGLGACSPPPAQVFDVALLDLDGVVYLGDEPVAHAAEALSAATAFGMRHAFVTNNALRTPEMVADRLTTMGVPAVASEVVTSAQATAAVLGQRVAPGARVLVVGGEGLRAAVTAAGFTLAANADDDPAAVAQGYDPTLDYARLAEGALAVARGAVWVACNGDTTVPTTRGRLPGNGALVALVSTATGRLPEFAGKPGWALHEQSLHRSGARSPLVVGDRLDTDIEGARRAGTPSLLVLTGVTDVSTLLSAPPPLRPDLVALDLRGMLAEHPSAAAGRCGGYVARLHDGEMSVTATEPTADTEASDALRAVVTAAWTATDAGGLTPTRVTGLPAPFPGELSLNAG